jgi:hypothetical protein
MNTLNAIAHLRKYILSDTGGTGTDWTVLTEASADAKKLLWSNEELAAFINEAQIQAFRRCLLQEDFGTAYDISIIAGTSTYTLHTKILQVIANQLESNGKELQLVDTRVLFELQNFDEDTGIPKFYSTNYKTGTVTFYPTPVANDTWHPLVYRLPLNTVTFSSPTAELEVADRFVIPMLSYAAYLAYMKQDADTYDPKQALVHKQNFIEEFGETSVYSDNKKMKNASNTVRYGGIRFNSGGPRPPVRIVRNSNG